MEETKTQHSSFDVLGVRIAAVQIPDVIDQSVRVSSE